jgi:hypothetical protein
MPEKVTVVYNLFNDHQQTFAELMEIAPLSSVKYQIVSRHHRGLIKNGFAEKGLKPVYLTAPKRSFVSYSLALQGFKPNDFIESVTIHGEWKIKKWQGYVFALKTWTIPTGQHIATRGNQAYPLIYQIIKLIKHNNGG